MLNSKQTMMIKMGMARNGLRVADIALMLDVTARHVRYVLKGSRGLSRKKTVALLGALGIPGSAFFSSSDSGEHVKGNVEIYREFNISAKQRCRMLISIETIPDDKGQCMGFPDEDRSYRRL